MRQIYKSKQNKAKGRAKYEVKEDGRRARDRIVGMWRKACLTLGKIRKERLD